MQGSPEDASGSEQNSAVDQIPSAEHTSQRMSVERAQDEDELEDDVDDNADSRPEEVDDVERDRVGVREASKGLERGDGDEERDTKEG